MTQIITKHLEEIIQKKDTKIKEKNAQIDLLKKWVEELLYFNDGKQEAKE